MTDEILSIHDRLRLIEEAAHELSYTYPLKDEFYKSKLRLIKFDVEKLLGEDNT